MATPCRGCIDDFEHCHGLLIIHVDGWIECSAPDCPGLDPVLHDARAECSVECEVCVVQPAEWRLAS